ncbi:peptide ABC transporter permease [Microvirga makkahensis]|uniref:Peptide ABC transporter permease n=1 Tax=Microvirga makkahensis TaxID=1128670 RepID=A0A7X3SQ69_9HYPH|nr:peptide ABC transporter permease [Microvirga makkahensis]MXQ13010.1 peptide ABC transporter permease [Microvirga makkahensis]
MVRSASPTAHPSTDAAALLRRLGFAILLFAIPLAALFTRRALVVMAPLAVALIGMAAFLDGSAKTPLQKAIGIATSRAGIAGFVLVLWSALSLIWTPFVPQASERLLNIIAMGLMAVAGYLALPERMRSANLYLLPVGVGLAALIGTVMLLREDGRLEPDGLGVERGMVVLVLLLWPALTWLHSRGRNLEAVALALAVAVGTVLTADPLPLIGLAVGAVAFALTAALPQTGSRLIGFLMAGLLISAPVLPFLLKPVAELAGAGSAAGTLDMWQALVLKEPLRFLTGHGLETAWRGRLFGLLPHAAPFSLLFEIWYELGIVGAMSGAVLLSQAALGAGGHRPILGPGIMASFASAFAFGACGIGTAQVWWFTALVVLVLVFVAVERGQFRTKRPKAILRRLR